MFFYVFEVLEYLSTVCEAMIVLVIQEQFLTDWFILTVYINFLLHY